MMDLAQYVKNVGKQINDSTKVNVDIDKGSVTNLVLISHLQDVYNWLEANSSAFDESFSQIQLVKVNDYINCLKKEMNFYETQDIDDNCILTETEEFIIQE